MEPPTSVSPGRTLMSEEMETGWLAERIVLSVLFLVSAGANSLALLVFCRRPGLRTISNRFVINLLATNLLTTSPLAIALFCEQSEGEDAVWKATSDAVAVACSLAALLAVMLIALDQHHAVTDPLRCHARLLQRRPASLCAATWLAAFIVAMIRATFSAVESKFSKETFPQENQIITLIQFGFYTIYLLLGIVVPASIVCIMYWRIYRAARSSGLRARAHGASALQLHEPPANLPDLVEEGEGLTLRIDVPDSTGATENTKFGPFLLPPERPIRCPSIASLRNARKEDKSSENLRKGLPSVSSAPSLAAPLLAVHQRTPQPSHNGSRITSIRCRISNASLFRYREESRAARVGLFTGALVMLHIPHAVVMMLSPLEDYQFLSTEGARMPSLALLLLASAVSPFLFALRSRRVQREARRLLLPEKSAWERAASAAAADGQRARAALELLRTLSPGGGGQAPPASGNGSEGGACRGSFSSGGSTQLSSASDE